MLCWTADIELAKAFVGASLIHTFAARAESVTGVARSHPLNQPLPKPYVALHNTRMRIAIVDESASRAAVIHEGIAALDDCEIFVVTQRRGLVARIGEIAPDIVLMDLGNPSRDMLEEYFAVSRAVARPIAMFVDESDDESIAASVEAGVSAYVVDGLAAHRIRPLLDLAVMRFNAFARLQSDLDEARGKLAERDAIDRAKRILMDSRGMPEPVAYKEMRDAAMKQGKRIADIAQAIITAHQLLGGKV
jgi:two-component system, response regulator / RNA-binding antiterminator